ncbi:hypothetical protein, partial [Thiolapillus sp.]|uniref:hypothetical protein n=1 Tax=Thiolapillus sp. TaxID=2017437 RepID=UPI003AF5F918
RIQQCEYFQYCAIVVEIIRHGIKKYSFQPCFCALYHKILPKKSIIMTLKIFQAISTVALRYQLLYIQTQLGELVAVPAL